MLDILVLICGRFEISYYWWFVYDNDCLVLIFNVEFGDMFFWFNNEGVY